uniref:WAP domain-containing protein n=1 Tax=Gongylonema pulchrum TaxID=637853 RepID=A0A183EZ35_9BILA
LRVANTDITNVAVVTDSIINATAEKRGTYMPYMVCLVGVGDGEDCHPERCCIKELKCCAGKLGGGRWPSALPFLDLFIFFGSNGRIH